MPDGSVGGKLAMQATEANPVVVFGTIKYTEPGIYMYTIVETNDGVKGVTYDTTTHNVVATVTDPNKNGELVCEVKYDGSDSLIITNTYTLEIPKTGDDTPIQSLALSSILSFGMMLVGAIGMLRCRRRENHLIVWS